MFGFLKRNKVSRDKLVQIYTDNLFDVIERGFPEVAEFINTEKQFEKSPQIGQADFEWFSYIIYGGNMLNLYQYFDEEEADDLKYKIIAEVAERYTKRDRVVAEDMILEYEKFLTDIQRKTSDVSKTISLALFYKFQLNDYQNEHFQKINTPNPVFFKELNEMMELFIWNWPEFLNKYKIGS